MVTRSSALCDGKIEYIENLYTVIDGKQINNQAKLDYLREKSQNKELFCTCGCGIHLQLVAGLHMTKAQHFRAYPNENSDKCLYKSESAKSIYSRISIKCWMEEKYGLKDLELRTRLLDSNVDKEIDFPCSSISSKIAVKYIDKNINLKKRKIDCLYKNSGGYRVFVFAGPDNFPRDGQYPEGLKYIQDQQGYALVLSSNEKMYESSTLRACIFEKDCRGLWELVELANEPLANYRFGDDGDLYVLGISLAKISQEKHEEYIDKNNAEKNHISQQSVPDKADSSKQFVLNMSKEEIRRKYLLEEQRAHEIERRNNKSQ